LQSVERSVMNSMPHGDESPRWRYLPAVALLGLFAFHVINNWNWVRTNVTLMGWDRSSHLAKTLIYNDVLREIDLRSLFTAMTWPWNRPPVPFLTAVPFYRLFGISTDVALMSNVVYLAILLCSVYGIGRILFSRKVGLLAAFLVSFYPVLFGISRLSYVDYALTAMVALALYLLLKTDRFRHRRWSLVFGLCMGLGILTKWPFIAFAGAPIGYVAWHSGALRNVLFVPWGNNEGTSGLRRMGTSLWFHALAALLVTAVWYVPNLDRLPAFVLGYWLPVLSWVLLTFTFYTLSRRPSPGANLLSAAMVGACLASAWSLPNIGFSGRFVFVAYGGVNIQGKGFSLLDPTFYGRYLSVLLTEQLSPLYFAALVVALAVLAFLSVKSSSSLPVWRRLGERGWILALWLVVPFLIYTLSQTWNSRFNIALLPAAALITARGLLAIMANRVKVALISVFVVLGLTQFFVLSYDSLYAVSQQTIIRLPIVGDLNLLGEGAHIMPPSTGPMDAGYWIAPRILGDAQQGSEGQKTLGLLVNYTYLNADIMRYLSLLEFPEIEIRDLSRDEGGPQVWINTFASDYVVVSTHDPYKLSDGAKEAVRRIYESPELFEQVFELRATYDFPNGEAVSLYAKRLPPADEEVQEYYRHLVGALEPLLGEGSAIVLVPPAEAATFAALYEAASPVYLLPTGDSEKDVRVLEEVAATHARVHAIFRDAEQTPQSPVERWLSENAYRAGDEWFGDVRMVLFGTQGDGIQPSPQHPVQSELGGEVSLVGYELADETIATDRILRLTLLWQSLAQASDDYVVFVHLLDGNGQLIAQHDGEPVGGFRSTTTWRPGDTVEDKHGMLIPPGTPQGEYRLVAGMYLPSTGERLLATGDEGEPGQDTLFLATISVGNEETASDGEGAE
jgi:4-amino-4-deoxy-L-arabinose transferase-like glycosyltransferase